MKKLLMLLAGIALIGFAGYYYTNQAAPLEDDAANNNMPREYALMLNDGSIGVLRYTNNERTEIFVRAYGETYNLSQVQAASGARFTNQDESVVFHQKGTSATLEVEGEMFDIPKVEEADIVEMSIEAGRQACTGVGSQMCLVVNDELFYDRIEGLDYQEGTRYEVIVARTIRANVPADANAYRYRLVTITETEEVTLAPTDETSTSTEGQTGALAGTAWEWTNTQYADGSSIAPEDPSDFTAQFSQKQFNSTTDCNNTFGPYEQNGDELIFGALASTLMACAGETLESTYGTDLSNVTNFSLKDNGDLVLTTKNGDEMNFVPTTVTN